MQLRERAAAARAARRGATRDDLGGHRRAGGQGRRGDRRGAQRRHRPWIVCALPGPRGGSAAQLALRLARPPGEMTLALSVAAGCELARAAARPGDRVVVCGSVYTVGAGAAVASDILNDSRARLARGSLLRAASAALGFLGFAPIVVAQ